jgi:hypothetical protein
VKVDAGMDLEPGLHVRGGVCRGVVDDRVKLPPGIASSGLFEEAEEARSTVGRRAFTDDLASGDLQGGAEAGETAALVGVGLTGRNDGAHRQKGLRLIEDLDLGLLVDADDDSVRRGIEIEPDDVGDLLLIVRTYGTEH